MARLAESFSRTNGTIDFLPSKPYIYLDKLPSPNCPITSALTSHRRNHDHVRKIRLPSCAGAPGELFPVLKLQSCTSSNQTNQITRCPNCFAPRVYKTIRKLTIPSFDPAISQIRHRDHHLQPARHRSSGRRAQGQQQRAALRRRGGPRPRRSGLLLPVRHAGGQEGRGESPGGCQQGRPAHLGTQGRAHRRRPGFRVAEAGRRRDRQPQHQALPVQAARGGHGVRPARRERRAGQVQARGRREARLAALHAYL